MPSSLKANSSAEPAHDTTPLASTPIRKTLGQHHREFLLAQGFSTKDAETVESMEWRQAGQQGDIWEFEEYCKEEEIKPTWYRYKQFRKLQKEKLSILVKSGGKDDRF